MPIRIESQAEPIPGYKLLERLGGGGFGDVWKAQAPGGVLKAIKFVYGNLLSVENDSGRAEQELKALSRVRGVRHPFILSLDRFDIIDGQLIIVMELADCNLWDHFQRCRAQGHLGIPRQQLLEYMKEAAEALDLMNLKYDLQHLDIKPQNLFLVHNHIKVADFGLVKDLEGLAATVTGGVTPVYAAPETFEGWVSRFSDQYSLAIVYQELLCAQRPFSGTNTRQLIMQHLQGQPNLDSLPKADRPAVAKALSKKPEDRFPSCLEFVRELHTSYRQSVPLTPPPPARPGAAPGPLQPSPASPSPPPPSPHPAPVAGPFTDFGPPADATSPGYGTTTAIPARPPVPEEKGDGVLFPAMVIGVGHLGLEVLLELRQDLRVRFGNLAHLPHLHLLYLDTDSESLEAAARQNAHDALSPDEVLLARLNRPGRYLRSRDLPPVEDWLDTKMCYRIPRSQVTTGIRALGRLAFIDHYRSIAARLRRDLERITVAQTLKDAAEQTHLGLRTNWPRVYIVTSLMGGTGGGMFLDLAYVIRGTLRELGYHSPETTGLLMLPPAEETTTDNSLVAANTYAALMELNHFATSGQPFRAFYDKSIGPVEDPGPPFNRCILLEVPSILDTLSVGNFFSTASEYLYRDLLTPLGREADTALAEQKEAATVGIPYSAVGLKVLSSPRQILIRRTGTSRRLGRAVIESWTRRLPQEMVPVMQQEMLEHFQKVRLDPPGFLASLRGALTGELGQELGPLVASFFEPIKNLEAPLVPLADNVRVVIRRIDELFGSPRHDASYWRPLRIPTFVNESAEQLVKHAEQALAGIIRDYLDRTGYRLGAVEEAVRQGVAGLEHWLKHSETEAYQLAGKLHALIQQLHADIDECANAEGKLRGARRARLMANLEERIHGYAQVRCEQLLVEQIGKAYLSLRGAVSDLMKDITFYRQRLQELLQLFKEPEDLARASGPLKLDGLQSSPLLAGGYGGVLEAVNEVVQALTPEDWAQLDITIQAAAQDQVHGLPAVFAAPGSDQLKELHALVLYQIDLFLERHLPKDDVADLFFNRPREDAALVDELVHTFEEARPALADQDLPIEGEIGIVVTPSSEAGRRFQQLAQKALPDIRPVSVSSQDEIVFYREQHGLALGDLKQAGRAAQDAYGRTRAMEHFTPHTRLDITAWKEIR